MVEFSIVKAHQSRTGFLCLALCALLSVPIASEATPPPAPSPDPAVFILKADSGEPVLRIPLGPAKAGLDLTSTVALAFKIKGEKGEEFVQFGLATQSGTPQRVPLGTVFDYLSSGITTDWKAIVLPITPRVSSSLPWADVLQVSFPESQQGTVYIKDLLAIPRLEGSEQWDTLAVPLKEYDITNLEDISVLVLDHLKGVGTRISEVRSEAEPTPEPAPLAAGEPKNWTPAYETGYYRVEDFESGKPPGVSNPFGTFQRSPSTARLSLVSQARPGAGGRSLRLDYKREPEGFCGLWIRLLPYSPSGSTRLYLNARPFHYLSFWIRAEGEVKDVRVQLADQRWEEKDDSVPLGSLSDYLRGGIGREWREVTIPLDPARYPNLDFSRLASLSLSFARPGSGRIYLDDVALKTSRDVRVPPTPPVPARPERESRRATWLWDPAPLFESREEREALFQFARREKLNVFFVQVHCDYRQEGEKQVCLLSQEEEFRHFIREAHERGIAVHALDGYSHYVLPPWQPKVLAQVQAILDYNARVFPQERFDGIHHDNEPYLLPAFTGKVGEKLLLYFLDLTYACQQLVARAPQRITYGVDIPFWYDTVEVTWHGVRKPVSAHAIDIVDEVGVMAYRTTAYGPNGVVALADSEVDYAGHHGKKAYVALETTPLPDQVSYSFVHRAGAQQTNSRAKQPVAYLVVEEWDGAAVLYWKELDAAGNAAPLPEWKGTSQPDFKGQRIFLSVERTVVPASQLSFAGLPAEDLESVVDEVLAEFRDKAGFAGVAIHHYESYRTLLGPRRARTSSRSSR
jgi:hypothetical protein